MAQGAPGQIIEASKDGLEVACGEQALTPDASATALAARR
jgi:methionyl-tRNA formyltransferase